MTLFSSDSLARWLLLLVALGVGGHLGWQWLTEPRGPVAELRDANPGWTVAQPRHSGLLLSDGASEPVVIDADHAGPLRLQRIDCAGVLRDLPTWLRLPPGRTTACVQLGGGEGAAGASSPAIRVLNHRTPESITALWTEGYARSLDEMGLAYWGGTSGGSADGPASTMPTRRYRTMSYGIDPAPGSAPLQVNLLAFYVGSETVMVVTLRPPPAAPGEAASKPSASSASPAVAGSGTLPTAAGPKARSSMRQLAA